MLKRFIDNVDVLGTIYTIWENDKIDDPSLENADGYCDHTTKAIVIDVLDNSDVNSLGNMNNYRSRVLRHELIHAFLFESGLGHESWGTDEEIVDWIAYQFPKMQKAFENLEGKVVKDDV